LKSANVTWQVNTTNSTTNNTMEKFWIYYSADYNVTAPNYTNPFNMSAFWRFDESSGSTSALDSSVYEFDGTLTNMNTAGNGTSGWSSSCKFGGCLKFDAHDDYVDTSATPSAVESTWMAWIYPVLEAGTEQHIVDGGSSAQFYISTSDNLRFEVNGVGTVTGIELQNNTWQHVVVVYSGSSVTLYQDGNETGSGTLTGISPAAIEIGRMASSSNYFNGSIDEVRIYNKALIADEVNATYNSIENPVSFKIFPEEEITALSPGKVRALQNLTYEELKRTMGEDYDFTVEIEEKQYIG